MMAGIVNSVMVPTLVGESVKMKIVNGRIFQEVAPTPSW